MDNRFGLKDAVVVGLLLICLLAIFLAMKEFDRQWEQVKEIRQQQEQQAGDIADIRRLLVQGAPAVEAPAPILSHPAPSTAPSTTPGPTTGQGTVFDTGADPFARIKAAERMPGYARGDWFVQGIPNTDKITPLVSGDVYAADIQGRVLETLAERDPVTLAWMPFIARSWQISSDGLTMTFQIRPGVTFSDGVPLTADDVVFSFDWMMNPRVEDPRDRSFYDKVKSVTKTNDLEVVFKFNEPYFDSFGLATQMNILPKHFYEKISPEDFNKSTGYLLGSGPYRLEDPTGWTPGKPLELVRNAQYWGEPAPFDKLVYRVIDNDLAHLTAFTNGEVDIFGATPDQYVSMLKDQELLKRTQHFEYDTAVSGYNYIAWNEMRDGKPTRFADVRVRQAMTMLTDRDRICKDILLGYATRATGPFNPLGLQYNHEVKPWPYDPARARRLLAEAGFHRGDDGVLRGPDGASFEFKLTYPTGRATYERIAIFLKESYAAAGIDLDPDPLDWSVFSDRLKTRNFDAISLGWSAGIEDDIYQMFHSSQIANEGDDFMSYKDEKLDELIVEARRTVDEKKRLPLWRECHAILHEDQPYTFLTYPKRLEFLDGRIRNVQKIPLGLNDLLEWYVPANLRRWEK